MKETLLKETFTLLFSTEVSAISAPHWLPTPVFLGFPGGSDSKKSSHSAGDLGSIPGLGRYPGGGMATHSSILAGRIPWTEELGGLQLMGLQRVGHD